MTRTRRTALGLCALFAALGLIWATAPTGPDTAAKWSSQSSIPPIAGSFDTITHSVQATDGARSGLGNTPEITVTNAAVASGAANTTYPVIVSARTYAYWRTSMSSIPGTPVDTAQAQLLNNLTLTYTMSASQGCAGGTVYDPASSPFRIGNGTVYTPAASSAASRHLAPGASLWLCATFTRTGSLSADQWLLNYAGRGVILETTLQTKTLPPATWVSAPSTTTSTYRVPLPPIQASTDIPGAAVGNVCLTDAATSQAALYWSWPTPAYSREATPTPAIHHYEVLRDDGGTWTPVKLPIGGTNTTQIPASYRDITWREGIRASVLNGTAPTRFLMRAYPTADRSVYATSTWIATVQNIDGQPTCTAVVTTETPPAGWP